MRTAWKTVPAIAAALMFAPVAQAGWVQENVPELGFSAVFPKAPERETSTSDGVKMTSFVAAIEGAMCIVIAADYPYIINPDVETVASRDNFAKGVKAEVASSQRITVQRGATSLQAMTFDAVSPTYTFRSIIIIDGARAYQVAGGVPKPDGDTAELDTCVRGFVLTPKS